MANAERAELARVNLSPKNPFGLTFEAKDHDRSLFIEEPITFGEGTPKDAQDLLRTVMLAHLVTRHFPVKVQTNFPVENTKFLDELYNHYGYSPPKIVKRGEIVIPKIIRGEPQKKQVKYANAHSGGLDSLYRAAKLYAEDFPMLFAHLRNLNPTGTLNEAVASRQQAGKFNVPYEEIRLRNGTDNTGFAVMRTRDMFLGLVTAMVAEPYKAEKVFIEGDMQVSPNSHFSEYAPAWKFFNKLIKEVGLNSQVEGMDAHDIETIGEVLKLEEYLGMDILPLVQNCFTPQYRIATYRRKWERETPVIAGNSSDHWCGSCAKCRRMTLGRIYYHDPRLSKMSGREVSYFIGDTYKWLKSSTNGGELASQSFLKHLDTLASERV